jgi:hypothetical protein
MYELAQKPKQVTPFHHSRCMSKTRRAVAKLKLRQLGDIRRNSPRLIALSRS